MLTYKIKGGTEGESGNESVPDEFARLCLSELLAQAEADREGQSDNPEQPANGTAGGS